MKLFYSQVRRLVLLLVFVFLTSCLLGQTTYTWNIAGGGSWATAGNWTPNRTTPAANDILVFSNGGTKTITNVPTQTIGKIRVTGNTNVTLQTAAANNTVTASTAANDAIDVDAGSTLQLVGVFSGGNEYTMTLTTANTVGLEASIDGTIIVTYPTNRPLAYGAFTKGGTNAIINFFAGSLYMHNVNGSLIPQSTWNVTSTCNITGLTNTAPSQLSQTFGNFTYSCPNHATAINFLGALTTINGNFTVNQAGNPQGMKVEFPLVLTNNNNTILSVGGNFTLSNTGVAAWFALTNGTAAVTMNVSGNFNMSGATTFFDYNIGTTQNSSLVINVTGNYTQSAGFLDWAWTPTSGSVASELRIGGNFTHSGTAIISMTQANTVSTVPNGKITFNKAGTQTFSSATPINIGYTNYEVANGSTLDLQSNIYLYSSNTARWGGGFTVKTGAILDANTNQFQSLAPNGVNNSFTLEAGSGILTANVNGLQTGITGTVYNIIATRTFSSSANYTYDGIAIQNSGIFTTTPVANQVNNLTINNTAGNYTTGVTLQQPIAVAGTCTFNAGALTTTATNLLTINDDAFTVGANNNASNPSFANGPVRKIGNDAFTFPVGKVVAPSFSAYRLCAISAPANATDAFTAEFIRASATVLGPVTAVGLKRVSACESWNINRTTGTSNVNVTLSWSGLINCNAAAYVTNLASLVVAHFSTSWDSYGNNGTSGTVSAGTVTWNYTGTYNGTGNTPFSLGSTSEIDNPLPVKFTNVTAYEVQNGNRVEWTNRSEEAIWGYELEKSANGRNFITSHTQQARMNNGGKADYDWLDVFPYSSITYYRIKATDRSGTVIYSPVVKVQTAGNIQDGMIVYPNTVINKQFTVQLSGAKGLYKIKLVNNFGQQITQRNWQHAGGMASRSIELPNIAVAGIYYLQLIGPNGTQQTKIFIQ